MIVERITVTDSPTSIRDLIVTARSNADTVPKKCRGITFKYLPSETKVVQLSDSATVTKVTILDNVTEGIGDAYFEEFDSNLSLLSTPTGTVEIDIIISQGIK